MRKYAHTVALVLAAVAAVMILTGPRTAGAASAAKIDREVRDALNNLYSTTPAARMLGEKAKAILVFPRIYKAGFIVGVQTGEGALLVNGKTDGYYNISAASYGLQAGVQAFGYALFLLTDSAVDYLHKSKGWELGVGPSIVVVDAGMAKTLTTTTAKKDIYAFTFGQRGLMAGLGLQGTKVTRLNK